MKYSVISTIKWGKKTNRNLVAALDEFRVTLLRGLRALRAVVVVNARDQTQRREAGGEEDFRALGSCVEKRDDVGP